MNKERETKLRERVKDVKGGEEWSWFESWSYQHMTIFATEEAKRGDRNEEGYKKSECRTNTSTRITNYSSSALQKQPKTLLYDTDSKQQHQNIETQQHRLNKERKSGKK